MIKFVPTQLLNIVNNKFILYYQTFIINKHYQIDQVKYQDYIIYLTFNLNNPSQSNCYSYYYKNKNYANISINAGDDIITLKQVDLQHPEIQKIILEYYRHTIAHELLHLIQFANPHKYYPFKKINNHASHEFKDIEFYPNLINYQYQAKDNLIKFIDNNKEINNIMNLDFKRYKKIVKLLYKDNYG